MKQSRRLKLISLLATIMLIASLCFTFAACNSTPGSGSSDSKGGTSATTPTDKNENITSVYGVYSHFTGYDVLSQSFGTNLVAAATSDKDFYEYDTLVLLEGDGQNTYILTRDLNLTAGDGMHFFQQYIGSFEWESGRTVTLNTPQEYSYVYNFTTSKFDETPGNQYGGVAFDDKCALHVKVDKSQAAIDAGKTVIMDNGKYLFEGENQANFKQGTSAPGLYGFNSNICDYHNRGGDAAMDVVIDLNNITFEYSLGD